MSARLRLNNLERQQHRSRRRWSGNLFAVALLSTALTQSLNWANCVVANETRHIKATAYYYPDKFYERNGLARPENIDFTKISRVNYASFQLDFDGNIWGTDANADAQVLFGPIDWNPSSNAKEYCHFASSETTPSSCQHHHIEKGLIRAAHSVGTRVYATIGGPDFSEPFSAMAADSEAREKFAKRCAQIITMYNFDGIDIDWRYPITTIDMANYMFILSEVRNELDIVGAEQGHRFGLTATLPCMPDKISNIDHVFLNLVLDEYSLLTVDFHGPWETKVGPSAPLYDRAGEQGFSVDSCVTTYVDAGALSENINVALPFYGLSFAGAFAIGQEATCNWAGDCSDTVAWQEDGGVPDYFNIYKKLAELNTTFDNETMASFAFGHSGIVSFDDERSICFKTDYVISHNLGGVLLLDLGSDLLDELSTPLLDAINLKLLNNDLSCESNAFMESLLRQESISHGGREDPIVVHDEPVIYSALMEDAELSAIDFLYSEDFKQEYRYTCGFGEGDARKKCSKLGWQEGHEEITCGTGSCPANQICFLSLCDVIPNAEFVKPAPKDKPKRKPPQIMTTLSEMLTEQAEGITPDDTTDLLNDNGMAFSCGVNFQHAESCGKPCPNGLVDCPIGQFCFWLECKEEVRKDNVDSSNSRVTVQQYKCGSTRDDALTCGEDCGSSWQCSDGKDCYLVPCTL